MTYATGIMFTVAALLTLAGAVFLLLLRASGISERQVYAFRMAGIMLAAAGIVLAFSAFATWRWSIAP